MIRYRRRKRKKTKRVRESGEETERERVIRRHRGSENRRINKIEDNRHAPLNARSLIVWTAAQVRQKTYLQL